MRHHALLNFTNEHRRRLVGACGGLSPPPEFLKNLLTNEQIKQFLKIFLWAYLHFNGLKYFPTLLLPKNMYL